MTLLSHFQLLGDDRASWRSHGEIESCSAA